MIICLPLVAADVLGSAGHSDKSVDGGGGFGSCTPQRPTYFSGIGKAIEVGKGECMCGGSELGAQDYGVTELHGN